MSQEKRVLSKNEKFQRRVLTVQQALKSGVLKTSVTFGISERTVRSWKLRFTQAGVEGLRDRSSRAKNVWNKKDKAGILRAALKRLHETEPGLNRMQVFSKLLVEEGSDLPTMSWISRARKELGLIQIRRVKVNLHTKRYEVPLPGALQVDTKYVPKHGEPGEHLYQFTAIDECSRVRFLGGSLTKGAEAARKFLVEALVFYSSIGVKVWRVQTDHGTEFTTPENNQTFEGIVRGTTEKHIFTAECERRGIKHRLIKIRTPELNGKVERSHRIDNEAFYSRFHFASESELDHALKNDWMPIYNEQRPHGSLSYKTPMEFLKEKLKELAEKTEDKNAA